jgi:glutamyl-tRNA synthetase
MHVPMILGSDGKRLSKRHGAVGVMQFRQEGFLPQALLNYLVRLGWSHGDQEIFSMAELIEYFAIEDINRAPAAFNPEKLLWLNQYYIKNSPRDVVAKELQWHMDQLKIDTKNGPALHDIIDVQSERCKTLLEMAERSRYFFADVQFNEELKQHFTPEIIPALNEVRQQLLNLNEWSKEKIHGVLAATAEQFGLKLGKIAQPIRIALTGGTVSPPIDVTILLMGRERVAARLAQACS